MLIPMRICACLLVLALGCGGDGVSPAAACAVDGECPLHQLCDSASKSCVTGCLADTDCPGERCGTHGRCVGLDDGGVDFAVGPDADPGSGDAGLPDLAAAPDLAACPGTCPDTALEPNDSTDKATVEAVPSTVANGAICPAGDVDWYTVTSTQAGTLDAVVTAGPCGAVVRADWFSSGGNLTIGTSGATASGWEATATTKAAQVRFLRVMSDPPGGQNRYSLALSLK